VRVLVTGAAGFIGSHLVNWYAANGHEVLGIDNYESAGSFSIDPRVRMVWGDIRRCKIVDIIESLEPDLINHHAARIDPRDSIREPAEDAKTNYIGTIHVLDGAIKAGCEKVIFASSCAVYGDIGASSMMVEGQFELPNCPYGISKLASEKYLRIACSANGIRVVILRYPNVYGPEQSGTRSTGVIAIFAHAMARGKPITIYGDGSAVYQYCYIDDILSANDAAAKWLENPRNTILLTNITGKAISVNDIAQSMASHFHGYELRINYEKPRDGEQQYITMRGDSADEKLGWKPVVNIGEGIERVAKVAEAHAAAETAEVANVGS
jgi:UDP-glucose 4-epimerase